MSRVKSMIVCSTFHEMNKAARDYRSDDPEYPGDAELRYRQIFLKLPPAARYQMYLEGKLEAKNG